MVRVGVYERGVREDPRFRLKNVDRNVVAILETMK